MSAPVLNPSRRAFLRRLVTAARPASAEPAAPPLAVIAGRFCLAYQHSFCSVCRERCPVPGAVVVERGLPRIDPTLCNGCRICHEVCPAPVKAIRLVPRPVGAPAVPPSAIPAAACA